MQLSLAACSWPCGCPVPGVGQAPLPRLYRGAGDNGKGTGTPGRGTVLPLGLGTIWRVDVGVQPGTDQRWEGSPAWGKSSFKESLGQDRSGPAHAGDTEPLWGWAGSWAWPRLLVKLQSSSGSLCPLQPCSGPAPARDSRAAWGWGTHCAGCCRLQMWCRFVECRAGINHPVTLQLS